MILRMLMNVRTICNLLFSFSRLMTHGLLSLVLASRKELKLHRVAQGLARAEGILDFSRVGDICHRRGESLRVRLLWQLALR